MSRAGPKGSKISEMSRRGAAGLGLLLALGGAGCPRKAMPPDGGTIDGPPRAVGGLTLVEIRGQYQAFSGLPAMKGIHIEDHNQHQLADGTWSINAYLSSADLIEAIRARGLQVKVLQTAEELVRESEKIAREMEAAEHPDASGRRER